MKQRYQACIVCGQAITAIYRTAYCPFCNRIIAFQKKIDKWPAEKKRHELKRYQRICSQISMSLSHQGHLLKSSHERAVAIIKARTDRARI